MSDPAPAVEREALVVSHRFETDLEGEPYAATVRLTGHRLGVEGAPRPQDSFVQEDAVERIVPGIGAVSITSLVYGLEPGDWAVEAELIKPHPDAARRSGTVAEPLGVAHWSWRRWSLSSGPAEPVKTRWAMLAPLAGKPGVLRGSWTVLGTIAAVVALATQAWIASQENLSVGQSLIVSVTALVFGMMGAKLWYAVLHPGPWPQALLGGWAVDGFLIVAPVVAVVALIVLNLPIGVYLDAAAPGLFFAVAIGRLGCFFTGCCAGRITRSRWGVWSSDGRLGARRIPAQLLESTVGVVLGIAAAWLVLGDQLGIDGAVFLGAFAIYLGARQALLRVRAESRLFSWRRSGAGARETTR